MTMFHVDTRDGYDYTYEMQAFNLDLIRENAADRIRQSIQEAEIILESLLDIAMEAEAGDVAKAPVGIAKTSYKATNSVKNGVNKVGRGVKKAGAKAKDLVAKFVEFFKNLYKRFIDNIQTLFQNNNKWLEERQDEFKEFDYSNMSTEMVPYWDGKVDTSSLKVVNAGLGSVAIRKILGDSKMLEDLNTLSKFQETHMKQYLDRDGDLKEGLKNYFRVSLPSGKDRVKLEGNNLRTLVLNTFIPNILNYSKYVDAAETELAKVNRELGVIAAEIDKRGLEVKESALFGRDIMDTEIAVHESLLAVFEAEGDNKTNSNNVKDSSTGDRTKVEITKDNRSDQQKQGNAENDRFTDRVSKENDNMLQLLRNVSTTEQLVVTSYLTVMEERYTAYMNALKAIWKASNTRGGRNKPKEEKEKKDDKK